MEFFFVFSDVAAPFFGRKRPGRREKIRTDLKNYKIIFGDWDGLTLAARGLEEPRNSRELLIESVSPVFLFCVFVTSFPFVVSPWS